MKKLEISSNGLCYTLYDDSGKRIIDHPFYGFASKLQKFISKRQYDAFIDDELAFFTLSDKKFNQFIELLTPTASK